MLDGFGRIVEVINKLVVNVGKDGILAGIDILKRYKLHVTKRSVNLIRELKNYKWKEDQAGKATNVPIDRFNHGLDTMRYAVLARALNRKRMVRLGSEGR